MISPPVSVMDLVNMARADLTSSVSSGLVSASLAFSASIASTTSACLDLLASSSASAAVLAAFRSSI
ncbi:hypothetical protein D3C87_1798570 [compost metagenome]